MSSNGAKKPTSKTLQRPKASTVFAAAFLAGAAAAVGVNRALDVHIAQNVPQVESESIFVALRSLPKGSPVTIYDVALRDWPVAMLPSTALRSDATFDGMVLRHPLREGQPILSLQIAKNTSEGQQQIASVTQAAQRSNQPQRTAAPAFIPYNAAPPIPATLASVQKQMTEHAAKDLKMQVPTTKQSESGSQPKVQKNALVEDFVSIEATPASVQSKGIQGTFPEPLQKEDGERAGDDRVRSEQTVSDEADHNTKPLHQELPSASADIAMESAEMVEEKSVVAENPVENIPAETKKEQLAETPDIQPHNSPLTQTTDVGDKKEKVVSELVLTEADLLSTPTQEENAVTQKATPEQSLTTTPDTTVSQQPDLVSASTISGNALDAEAPVSKKPTLAPPSVEPVDITQSILAEAETQKNTVEDIPQKTSVAALPQKFAPTVAPDTSTKGRSASTKASSETMRYLVVPERIAVQVDQAFTMPQQVTSPALPAKASPPVQGNNVQPLPKTTAARTRPLQQTVLQNRPAPKASAPSQARQLQAAAGNAPRSQRSSNKESSRQVASRESNKETSKEPLLRSFFPKISAGLSAVGQEWREFRDGTETSEENPSSRQAKQSEPRQQRSASRPQQSR
jgi:hypothetical protein